MMAERALEGQIHPDCIWYPNGQSGLTGSLLRLFRRVDRLFGEWASALGAREYLFPPFIPAAEIDKIDYFRSFPHLVTFPAALHPDPTNLQRFARSPMRPAASGDGAVRITQLAPIRDVLTPAACHHFYIAFRGETLNEPRIVTTLGTCFRREARYTPLERQWSFSMREIVCIGSPEEVKQFLAGIRERVDLFVRSIGLPLEWQDGTDPFFDPMRNPKYIMQRIEPHKTEMLFGNGGKGLAIGSINSHQGALSEAFGIRRAGEVAFSGCVAFGVERWVHALLTRFGWDERDWPALGWDPDLGRRHG